MSNRRLNLSSSLGVLAVATLIASATACIFDDGSYKGGGRLDTAGTAKQNTSSTSSSGSVLDDDDDIIIDSGFTTSSGSLIDTGIK